MKRHISRAGLLLAVVALTSAISMAQAPAVGTPAWGSFGGGPFDVINLGNLNVHFAIHRQRDTTKLSGRGGVPSHQPVNGVHLFA